MGCASPNTSLMFRQRQKYSIGIHDTDVTMAAIKLMSFSHSIRFNTFDVSPDNIHFSTTLFDKMLVDPSSTEKHSMTAHNMYLVFYKYFMIISITTVPSD